VGDDHFDDLGRKFGDGRRACGIRSLQRRICGEPLLDLGSTSVPNSLRWDIIIKKNTKKRVPELPDSEEVGVFVGDIMGWVEWDVLGMNMICSNVTPPRQKKVVRGASDLPLPVWPVFFRDRGRFSAQVSFNSLTTPRMIIFP